jgi:tetratricopeptide (TPR) repeat protein
MEFTAEALADMQAIVRDYEAAFGATDPDTLRARGELVDHYARHSKYREAEAMSLALQPLLERHLKPDDAAIWQNRRWHAVALSELGHYERAEQAYLTLIPQVASQLGADHPSTMGLQGGLSIHYLRNERYDKAEAVLRDLYPRGLRVLGERNASVIQYGSALGSALRLGGKVAESEPWYRQALERSIATYGPDNPATTRYEINYANLEIDLGKPAEALARIDRVAPLVAKQRGERSQAMLEAWRTRGRANTALGRVEAARRAWQTSLDIGSEIFGGRDHAMLKEDRDALAALDGKTPAVPSPATP